LADDRRHVMLAMRLERYVLEQHDLVVAAHLLEHAGKVMGWVLRIAPAIFLPRAGHPLGRIEQSLASRIVSAPADQGADRFLHLVRDRKPRIHALDKVAIFRSSHNASP